MIQDRDPGDETQEAPGFLLIAATPRAMRRRFKEGMEAMSPEQWEEIVLGSLDFQEVALRSFDAVFGTGEETE